MSQALRAAPQRYDAPRMIQTARLRLRPPRLTDAGAIFSRYASDPETTRYLSWRPHRSETETFEFICHCLDSWAELTSFAYVIETLEKPGEATGMVQISPREHEAVLGYVLAPDLRGRGLLPEALTPLIGWALDQSSLWRVSAFCDAENAASARVMEKVGMRREGLLRRYAVFPNVSETPRDCLLYATVREA